MASPALKKKCYTCGDQANFTIMLAITDRRIYLPNQAVRDSTSPKHSGYGEVAFCSSCMRKIEDSLRATILYLQSENEVTPPTVW